MSIDELRSTLRVHSGDVDEIGSAARLHAVNDRIRTTRRRRAAAAVIGTAAAVTVIALGVVPGIDREPNAGPAQGPVTEVPPAGGYAKDGVVYRDVVLGEHLLGAAIGDPGQSQVRFQVPVGRVGLRFSPTCFGVGPEFTVELRVAGQPVSGTGCRPEKDPDPGANGSTLDADPIAVLRDWGARAGDEVTVGVALVRTRSGAPANAPSAVIGAGIYEDTRPMREVAGLELPEAVEHDGHTWWLQWTYASDPGGDSVHVTSPPGGEPADALVLAAVSGLEGRSAYEIRLDGAAIGGSRDATGELGPAWQTAHVLKKGESYDLRLVVTRGVGENTRLALVTYVRQD